MEKETCWKIRLFWPWQDDREEEWLEAISRDGWHLSKVGFSGVYFFHKGEPKHTVYRMDYQIPSKKDRGAYLQLFRDAGWEHLGGSGWEYFRKEASPDEEPEIFTDPESKIKKYERICNDMVLLLAVLIVTGSSANLTLPGRGLLAVALQCMSFGLLASCAAAMIGIVRRIHQLKNSIRKNDT